MVEFGISFEGIPHIPFTESNEGYLIPDATLDQLSDLHKESLEQSIETAVEAESLGFSYITHPEHHFELLGASSPNPLVTQTAIARETEDIRLLQMANILSWHEPVRLAETVSMVDILSDGRVEVGISPSGRPIPTTVFGQYWGGTTANKLKNDALFDEKFEILVRSWTQNLVSHDGEFHQVPPSYTEHEDPQEIAYFKDSVCESQPRDYVAKTEDAYTLEGLPVVPHPEQDPHPQLWRPTMSASSAIWAARRGINACVHLFDMAQVDTVIDAYYTAAKEANWPDRKDEHDGSAFDYGWDQQRSRGVGLTIPIFNTDVADAEAIDRWKRAFKYEEQYRTDGKAKSFDVDEKIHEDVSPVFGDTDELIDAISGIIEELQLQDALIICYPHSTGLKYEERRDQMRSLANEVVPAISTD